MRWLIRTANIDRGLRDTFDRYDIGTMQNLLARAGQFRHIDGNLKNVSTVENDLLAWLTEEHDKAERKETWSLTMEAAITVFVFSELLFSIFGRDAVISLVKVLFPVFRCSLRIF
jgi:hypothetical protein